MEDVFGKQINNENGYTNYTENTYGWLAREIWGNIIPLIS